MEEQCWADCFSYQVDEILREVGSSAAAPVPPGYEQELGLARLLASTDFSGESRVRRQLLPHLLESRGTKRWEVLQTCGRKRGLWLALTAAAVVLPALSLLIAALAHRDMSASAAANLRSLTFSGEGTSRSYGLLAPLASPSPVSAQPMVEHEDDFWVVRTAIGNFTYRAPANEEGSATRFTSFEGAQANVAFSLHQPGYLPDGYSLREAMVTPVQWAFLFYDGPNGDIVLVQAPVRVGTQAPDGSIVAVPVGRMTLTDREVRLVRVGGSVASWVEGLGLIWQTENTGYHLGGANMNLDEATHIAETLE